MVFQYAVIVFVSQLIFIGCRTWNVKAIAEKNIPQVLISGTFVHLAWLISIAIGAVSMNEIITKFQWEYWPVVLCSLSGGLIGSYIAMKNKRLEDDLSRKSKSTGNEGKAIQRSLNTLDSVFTSKEYFAAMEANGYERRKLKQYGARHLWKYCDYLGKKVWKKREVL